jgi:antitoxin component of MazEF toxin-antitoxin module
MPIYTIKKVSGKEVAIPEEMLQVLGVNDGDYITFKGSKSSKEITVTPLVTPSTKTAELKVLLQNVPGTNANVDAVLGRLGINILFGMGGLVENNVYSSAKLLDISTCPCGVKDVRKELENIPEVIDVYIKEL